MPYFMVYIAGLHEQAVRIRAKSERDALRKIRLMMRRKKPRRFSVASKTGFSRVLIG